MRYVPTVRKARAGDVSDAYGFNEAYKGVPPWEIGRPQGEFVRLEEAGRIGRSVLDVGCGTGELAIHLANTGHEVLGVDAAPLAIERAKAKAAERGSGAEFLVWDALDLAGLGRTFDTAVDSGVFHTFDDDQRARYASSLHAALKAGGVYHMMCFSEHEPGSWGPRRVTQAEIRATFDDGWRVEEIVEAAFETNLETERVRAWRATIARG